MSENVEQFLGLCKQFEFPVGGGGKGEGRLWTEGFQNRHFGERDSAVLQYLTLLAANEPFAVIRVTQKLALKGAEEEM